MRQSVSVAPNGAKQPTANELRKLRKEHLAHERARRRRQTKVQDDDQAAGLEQEENTLADEAPA